MEKQYIEMWDGLIIDLDGVYKVEKMRAEQSFLIYIYKGLMPTPYDFSDDEKLRDEKYIEIKDKLIK